VKEPNFNCQSIHTGGYLEEIPEPHIRMFPNGAGRKREVRVKLSTYVGTNAIGATHFYAAIKEEHNRVWNGKYWQAPWDDDPEHTGREFGRNVRHNEFATALQAKTYAEKVIAEHFNSNEYEIRWDIMRTFHLYLRDGD